MVFRQGSVRPTGEYTNGRNWTLDENQFRIAILSLAATVFLKYLDYDR